MYTLLGNTLTTVQAFTVMSIFLVLQAPLADFPNFMAQFLDLVNSLTKIEEFLKADEIDVKHIT